MKALVWLLLALLVVPGALGHFSDGTPIGQDVHVQETVIEAASAFYTSVNWNNQERLVLSVNTVNLTQEAPVHRDILITLDLTLTFIHTSGGTGQIVLLDNGEFSQTCSSQSTTVDTSPGLTGHPDIPEGRHFTLRCLYEDALQNDTHNFTVFLSTVSGAPSQVTKLNFAAEAQQIDYYQVESMEVSITEFAFWIPLLFWLGLLILSLWQDWTWSAAFTVPGLLQTLFPAQVPGEFAEYFLLVVLGFVLEYFSWRGSERRKEVGL